MLDGTPSKFLEPLLLAFNPAILPVSVCGYRPNTNTVKIHGRLKASGKATLKIDYCILWRPGPATPKLIKQSDEITDIWNNQKIAEIANTPKVSNNKDKHKSQNKFLSNMEHVDFVIRPV